MAGVEARSFDSPDETRTPDKTRIDLVRMTGAARHDTSASFIPAVWPYSTRMAPRSS